MMKAEGKERMQNEEWGQQFRRNLKNLARTLVQGNKNGRGRHPTTVY